MDAERDREIIRLWNELRRLQRAGLPTASIVRRIEQALAGKKTAKQALDSAVERGNQMLRQFEKTAVH
ncbi:MAG TPA: hypothetical protein DEH75_10155 [Bradyrhizobium sp.]|nr:hypothetical protein [Bradyrhizobium sp.]